MALRTFNIGMPLSKRKKAMVKSGATPFIGINIMALGAFG